MMYWRCPAIINQMGDWSTNGSIGFYIVSCIIFFHILLKTLDASLFSLCLLFLLKVIVREWLELLIVCHPLMYYVFLSLSATHIRHTCNVQWLTIFPLFINYSHFLKENGKYTQTELFVLQMKSFWIDLCCPNKDSDSVLLTIFSHFSANHLYSYMVTDQQWQHFFVYLGDHHKTDFYISVYYSNTANSFSNHEYFDKS